MIPERIIELKYKKNKMWAIFVSYNLGKCGSNVKIPGAVKNQEHMTNMHYCDKCTSISDKIVVVLVFLGNTF